MSQSLPKNMRLCDDLLIESLFKKGRKIEHGCVGLQYLSSDSFQVAFGAPKRKFQKAVERNRIKRLLRESFRLHYKDILKEDCKGLGYFIYKGNTALSFGEIEASMIAVLRSWKAL